MKHQLTLVQHTYTGTLLGSTSLLLFCGSLWHLSHSILVNPLQSLHGKINFVMDCASPMVICKLGKLTESLLKYYIVGQNSVFPNRKLILCDQNAQKVAFFRYVGDHMNKSKFVKSFKNLLITTGQILVTIGKHAEYDYKIAGSELVLGR